MSSEAIQGVSKTSETQSLQKTEETGAEHFQNLMDQSNPSSIQSNFERVDVSQFNIENIENGHQDFNKLEPENVTPHQLGSATDQENKRQGGGQKNEDQDEVEEISGVEGTKSKKGVSETSGAASGQEASVESLSKQTTDISHQMDGIKNQLNQAPPNAEIKSSYQKLLKNHLVHVDDNLKIASSKVGLEYTPTPPSNEKSNPLKKFVEMVTNSQNQMNNLHLTLGEIDPKKGMSPVQALTLQAKMGVISHQLELFSTLLSKALEATKTLMNVQV